jgi:DNA-binding NtrC family response regulator
MRNILFFSPDLNFCASLLMFFNEKYTVTTTTSLETFENILQNSNFDLLVIDSEPTPKVNSLCKKISNVEKHIPVFLTYVYTIKYKETEHELKKIVDAIFYKPIDLAEVSQKIDFFLKKLTYS